MARWIKRPSKSDLMRGVSDWVITKAGVEYAHFDYLHQLTTNDLTLIAMAMGFKPDPVDRANLERHYKSRRMAVKKK